LYELTNKERPTTKKLIVDKLLERKAAQRAEEACKKWEHGAGYEAMQKTLPKRSWVGENLAKDHQTPEAAHKALMASPKHKENIIHDYAKRVGIAAGKSCNSYAEIFSSNPR
jgi:uncharacterized protein YkwD